MPSVSLHERLLGVLFIIHDDTKTTWTTAKELEHAFSVYFAEMERCRRGATYWALLHVVLALPDICAALESENSWATGEKYVEWCRQYCPSGVPSPEDYRDLRNLV